MNNQTMALLYKIEAVAGSLSTRARWLSDDCAALTRRPDWKTKAEAEVTLAEQELEAALAVVKQVRAAWPKKPVEFLQAAE